MNDHIKHLQPTYYPFADQGAYQKLIDKILYLTMTRPNNVFSVQTPSQFIQDTKKSQMKMALKVVKYIKNQTGQSVLILVSQEIR